jgi:hypothetical protein
VRTLAVVVIATATAHSGSWTQHTPRRPSRPPCPGSPSSKPKTPSPGPNTERRASEATAHSYATPRAYTGHRPASERPPPQPPRTTRERPPRASHASALARAPYASPSAPQHAKPAHPRGFETSCAPCVGPAATTPAPDSRAHSRTRPPRPRRSHADGGRQPPQRDVSTRSCRHATDIALAPGHLKRPRLLGARRGDHLAIDAPGLDRLHPRRLRARRRAPGAEIAPRPTD